LFRKNDKRWFGVLDWWYRLFPQKPAAGTAPGTGRQKTYSAESGYVYQYVLSSFRQHRRRGEEVYEYLFAVSGGRAALVNLSVSLHSSVLERWAAQHRELSASERYGIAKISLKRQLDASESPASLPLSISPQLNEIDDIAAFLGL
jgi:hypothetical protein